MASLTPKNREVLILWDVQHLSIAETATILGITEASVKTRLLRARLRMRDALAPGIDGSWTTGTDEYKKSGPGRKDVCNNFAVMISTLYGD